jgi:hypothetical protein
MGVCLVSRNWPTLHDHASRVRRVALLPIGHVAITFCIPLGRAGLGRLLGFSRVRGATRCDTSTFLATAGDCAILAVFAVCALALVDFAIDALLGPLTVLVPSLTIVALVWLQRGHLSVAAGLYVSYLPIRVASCLSAAFGLAIALPTVPIAARIDPVAIWLFVGGAILASLAAYPSYRRLREPSLSAGMVDAGPRVDQYASGELPTDGANGVQRSSKRHRDRSAKAASLIQRTAL